MGVYQKTGVRNIAIYVVDFITWVRQYGFKAGFPIFSALSKTKKDFFTIHSPYFKNTIWLRNNFSDKAIFNQVFYQRQYFLERLQTIEPDTIIDAGANIGLASVYFSQLFPSSQIIAIEPEKDNFALLKKNTTAYTNVTCIQAALWYKQENIDIQNPDSLPASYIVEARDNAAIQGITITSLLQKYNWQTIDILKMDIEGAEKEIFSGNVDWLQQVKLLIIELHDNYKTDCTKTFFKAIEPYHYEAVFHHENIFVFFK